MSATGPHPRRTSAAGKLADALRARTPEQFNARMGPAMKQINPALLDADQISIDRCRELLGDEAIGLSDEQVDQIRRHAETMAHVVIDAFFEDRSTTL